MKAIIVSLAFLAFLNVEAAAQTKAKAKRTPPVKMATAVNTDRGKVSGRTYTNQTLGFTVTFPDSWLIPGDDFESYMKQQGYDLSLKAPATLPAATKAQVNKAVQKVDMLLTTYRSTPGMPDNAIVRVSTERLDDPKIKDAVDYFDAMRATFKAMKLPADFKYSETQAEKLGNMQFGFIDAEAKAGKKRMYATVRNGLAIMFTLSYTKEDDLQTLRKVLSDGNFFLK